MSSQHASGKPNFTLPPIPVDIAGVPCGLETGRLVAFARHTRGQYLRQLLRAVAALGVESGHDRR